MALSHDEVIRALGPLRLESRGHIDPDCYVVGAVVLIHVRYPDGSDGLLPARSEGLGGFAELGIVSGYVNEVSAEMRT